MSGSTDWKVWPIAESESATDMKVSTHRIDHSGEFYFKVEGTVVGASKLAVSVLNLFGQILNTRIKYSNLSYIQLIAALVEIELYSTWMPLCAKSEVIHSLGPYRRLLKSVIDFILFRREVLLLGYVTLYVLCSSFEFHALKKYNY